MSTRHRTLDRLFAVLSHRHRRRLLVLLGERPGRSPLDLETLSAGLAVDSDDVERVRLQLYHTHLPKLSEFGFVRWDPEADAVERGPEWEVCEPLLPVLGDAEVGPADSLD